MLKWLIRTFSIFDNDVKDTKPIKKDTESVKTIENKPSIVETTLKKSLECINTLKRISETFDDVLLHEIIILTTQIHNSFIGKNEIEVIALEKHHIYRTMPFIKALDGRMKNRHSENEKSTLLINQYQETIALLENDILNIVESKNAMLEHELEIKDMLFVLRNISRGLEDNRIESILVKAIPHTYEVDESFEVPDLEYVGGFSLDKKLLKSLNIMRNVSYLGTLINGNVSYDVIKIGSEYFLYNVLDSIIFSFDNEEDVISEENSTSEKRKAKINQLKVLITNEKARLKRGNTLDRDVRKSLSEYIKELENLEYFKTENNDIDVEHIDLLMKNIKLDE